jgi:hypothetical protein
MRIMDFGLELNRKLTIVDDRGTKVFTADGPEHAGRELWPRKGN